MNGDFVARHESPMLAKTTVKTDPAAELAKKMVAVLEKQRRRGSDFYPLTGERLAQESDPLANPEILQKAIKKTKGFLDKVIVVRHGDVLSPLALLEDGQSLAESPRVLEYLLRLSRTPTNQAISVAQMKNKVSGGLKKSFAEAANRLVDENRLPQGIAWIFVNRTRKLFFIDELHRSAQPSDQGSRVSSDQDGVHAAPAITPSTSTADFSEAFDAAFEKLNRQEGSMNFVSLVDLRRALSSYPLPVFDAELRKLWSEGRYSLRAAEGRFGISPEEREAGFLQEGTLLLFVSRNA